MSLSQMQSNFLIKMRSRLAFSGSFKSSISMRSISTTQTLLVNRRQKAREENKNRPFGQQHTGRDHLTAKAIHWKEKEGYKILQRALAKHVAQPPGKIDQANNKFKIIPEMVPEFIVPDLTDFELKPYISYQAEIIEQDKITARKLFNLCYAKKIKEIKAKKVIAQETPSATEDPTVK